MATQVSMNGALVGPEAATVSVFDRGFLYGDSVYEVVRTYSGVPFELEAHLVRLEGSAARIGMEVPCPRAQLAEEVRVAHRASGNSESYLRIVVTRGSGTLGLDPGLAAEPLRMVIAMPLRLPPPEAYSDGIEVALVGVRRNLKEAIDPGAKTGNYLNSVLALAEAKRRGADEAVMLDHRGFVTEGASSNVFVVLGDTLFTPPLEVGILAGITRDVVLRTVAEAGIRLLETPFAPDLLRRADEAFITSSVREMLSVVRVDGSSVGTGRPGPMFARVKAAFAEHVARYVAAHG